MSEMFYRTPMTQITHEAYNELLDIARYVSGAFLIVLNMVDSSYKSVDITFDEVDADEYGDNDSEGFYKSKPVVSLLVTLTGTYNERGKVKCVGYYPYVYYKVTEVSTGELLFEGMEEEVNYHFRKEFKELNEEEIDSKYKIEILAHDPYLNTFMENPPYLHFETLLG